MIGRDLFQQLGGFDELFAPAYYEDSDLCFRVRASGKRVVVQPASEIIHLEGISAGTDTAGTGMKRYQVINHAKFYRRWKDVLITHRLNGQEPELEAERTVRKRAYFIDDTVPTPDQDAGLQRRARSHADAGRARLQGDVRAGRQHGQDRPLHRQPSEARDRMPALPDLLVGGGGVPEGQTQARPSLFAPLHQRQQIRDDGAALLPRLPHRLLRGRPALPAHGAAGGDRGQCRSDRGGGGSAADRDGGGAERGLRDRALPGRGGDAARGGAAIADRGGAVDGAGASHAAAVQRTLRQRICRRVRPSAQRRRDPVLSSAGSCRCCNGRRPTAPPT